MKVYKRNIIRAQITYYSHTLIVECLSKSLSPTGRSFRQKLSIEILKQINITNQMDQIDIDRTFHTPNIKKNSFFSASHRTFFKIGHIFRHKASFNIYKKIVSHHHRLKLVINKNKSNRKFPNS